MTQPFLETPPRVVSIDVRGQPRPQGSMKMHRLPNGGVAARYPAQVWEWRYKVQQAVAAAEEPQFTGAVELRLGFELMRPAGHYLPTNSRRNVVELSPKAPPLPIVAPDLDKLVRAVCDAITDAGLWRDDSQVVTIRAAKRYATSTPGVLIKITEAT